MNHCVLTASIAERAPVRYTPAGLVALDLWLEHESRLPQEEGGMRTVRLKIKALALGDLAERLASLSLESARRFEGFLTTPYRRRSILFHIQNIQEI